MDVSKCPVQYYKQYALLVMLLSLLAALAGRGQGRDSASEEQGILQVCTNRNMDIDELLYNILTSPVLAIFPDSICVTSAPSEATLARAGHRQGRGQESASCSE